MAECLCLSIFPGNLPALHWMSCEGITVMLISWEQTWGGEGFGFFGGVFGVFFGFVLVFCFVLFGDFLFVCFGFRFFFCLVCFSFVV